MEFLWTLIIGLIAGVLARAIMPGRDPAGVVVTMLLGVAGSFVAALLGRALGWYSDVDDAPGIIASILGALLLLGLYRLVLSFRRRR